MKNVPNKRRENKKVHSIAFLFSENLAVYEKMCEEYCRAGQATDDNIIRRMRFACWVPKATNKHSGYAILIVFLLQQWLHERASILRLYEHCLSCCTYDVSFVLRITPFSSAPDRSS
jgi:hypothetical protein